jgi:tRNA-specific 2-thiouridylase
MEMVMEAEEGGSLLLEHALACLRALPGLTPGARVLAAMSGGIDSSVMAALLHRGGFEVVGVSMQLFDKSKAEGAGDVEGKCCTLDDFQDARRVAFQCGFPHYVLDLEERFQATVIEDFVAAYLQGETPSPCIRCNQYLKFRTLLDTADGLGAAFVATGHYARITRDGQGYHLRKAADPLKDQSYFLFTHDQASLARTLFPLSGLAKPEVRQLARDLGLHLAEKPESQEICFVTQGRYDAWLEDEGRSPVQERPGPIRHVDGRHLGSHAGFWRYTVGQRKGLGIAFASPLFVVRVDPATDTVWVGGEADLLGQSLTAREVSWCGPAPLAPLPCSAKIRSRSAEVPVRVQPLADGRVRVDFQEPQRAIAPGQAVVFYDGDEVLGGGWIETAG